MCMNAGVWVPWQTDDGQKTTSRSHFSSSPIGLNSQHQAYLASTLPIEPACSSQSDYQQQNNQIIFSYVFVVAFTEGGK